MKHIAAGIATGYLVIATLSIIIGISSADFKASGPCVTGRFSRVEKVLGLDNFQKLGCYLGEIVESN
jgi:hypothetical protein